MSSFSPVFTIDTTAAFAAGNTATITNPGQAFTVVGLLVSGDPLDPGATVTIRKNSGAGVTAATAITIAAGSSCQITSANQDFLSTDNVHITVATKAVTKITLLCRSAVASTWTNTTPA